MLLNPQCWHAYKTRITGWVSAGLGVLAYIDHETINSIGSLLGPVWGPRAVRLALIAAGLTTAFIGHQNARMFPPPVYPVGQEPWRGG
jgi:hypothetical protein